jgi:prepilin-type N-terminal cleavage/methylation domain-containing protein
MTRPAFTLLEALVVIAILAIVLALVAGAWRRAKRTAQVIADSAQIRSKLDDAVIRGAIRSHKQHDEWRKQFDRMLQSGLKQGS